MFAKSKIQKAPKVAARRPQAALRPNFLIATTPTVAKSDLIENKATSKFLIATKFHPQTNNFRRGFVARASPVFLSAAAVCPRLCAFVAATKYRNSGSQTARHSSPVTCHSSFPNRDTKTIRNVRKPLKTWNRHHF